MLGFELLVLAAVLTGIAVTAVYCLRTGAPPISSTYTSARAIAGVVPADARVILELGAGCGRLAFALARRHPRAKVIAFEISPVPWLFMRLRQLVLPRRNLVVRRADFRRLRLPEADVAVCFLCYEIMPRLLPQLQRQMAPGAVLISSGFDIPGLPPAAVHDSGDGLAPHIYVYRLGGGPPDQPSSHSGSSAFRMSIT